MAWSPGSKWSLSSHWFVWLMYLCHSVWREGTVVEVWFRFQSVCPVSPGSTSLTRLFHPLSLSFFPFISLSRGLPLSSPSLCGHYLVLKYHKVYRKSCATGDISINLHICQMCSVHGALGWNVSLHAVPVMAVPIERGKQRTVNIKSLFVTLFCLLCYVQFAVLHPLSLRPTHSHKVNMWGGFTAATAKCQFHNHLWMIQP